MALRRSDAPRNEGYRPSSRVRRASAMSRPNARHFSGVTTAPLALANGNSIARQTLGSFTLWQAHITDTQLAVVSEQWWRAVNMNLYFGKIPSMP